MEIREMTIGDYERVHSLWESAEGVGLHSEADSRDRTAIYLQRNPGLSFTAWEKGELVGAVLCGHDSRRGYLHHLVVAESYRRRDVGRALVERVLCKLRLLGIRRCHIFVFGDNPAALGFWNQIGWAERADLRVMSKDITL